MKIGIQTWGSHGDIRPFVALAGGLQAAGHEVTLVITCVDSERYGGLSTASGFRLRVVSTPVVPDRLLLESIGDTIVRERNAIRQTRLAIEQLLLPAESEMYRASEQLCAENELVIGHYFLYTLGAAAERYGRPYVSVVLADGAVPSAFKPPSGVPNLGTFSNRVAWRLARSVLNQALKKYPDRLRARHDVAPARDMIDNVWASDYLTLLAISPAICQRKPDWPNHYVVCGALDTQESVAEGCVPEQLQSFLSSGSPPIYMTFGSMMSGSNQGQTIALLAGAAQKASVRAVIQAPGWEQLGLECSSQVHYVSSAPHFAVFPLCGAVVHHGGAGTSQAALRAGIPSVIVPHTAEQELWSRELEKMGVAYKPIPRKRATPARIASAINQVAASGRICENARTLGARVAEEKGVETAVRVIGDRIAA
ncbi:glycosyltransferase [Lysobacter sp. A3-1-A15]|uniref:glycosyltransferase n=1 Tax=Novilysobacter viscosus TaxID=3098602 RepID=UPI002EDBA570